MPQETFTPTYIPTSQTGSGVTPGRDYNMNYADEATARQAAAMVGGEAVYQPGWDFNGQQVPGEWQIKLGPSTMNAGVLADQLTKDPVLAVRQISDQMKALQPGYQWTPPAGSDLGTKASAQLANYKSNPRSLDDWLQNGQIENNVPTNSNPASRGTGSTPPSGSYSYIPPQSGRGATWDGSNYSVRWQNPATGGGAYSVYQNQQGNTYSPTLNTRPSMGGGNSLTGLQSSANTDWLNPSNNIMQNPVTYPDPTFPTSQYVPPSNSMSTGGQFNFNPEVGGGPVFTPGSNAQGLTANAFGMRRPNQIKLGS